MIVLTTIHQYTLISASRRKHHCGRSRTDTVKRSGEPLGLVHSDVFGKMNTQSLSGAEYFFTFIDKSTRYVRAYFLKRKDEVLKRCLERKVQRATVVVNIRPQSLKTT